MAEVMALLAGIYDLAFALFHVVCWSALGLDRELRYGTRLTLALCRILNFAVAYMLAVIAVLCIVFRAEMTTQPIGRSLLAAMACFWLARSAAQAWMVPLPLRRNLPWVVVFVVGATVHAIAAYGGFGR